MSDSKRTTKRNNAKHTDTKHSSVRRDNNSDVSLNTTDRVKDVGNQLVSVSDTFAMKIFGSKAVRFTMQGVYSVSSAEQARGVLDICRSACHAAKKSIHTMTILDANACIGGNSVHFAKIFRRSVLVELDPINIEALRYNLRSLLLKKDERKVEIIEGNCVPMVNRVALDIMFYDPPWEQRDQHNVPYYTYDQLTYTSDDVAFMCRGVWLVIFKLPLDCPIERFPTSLYESSAVVKVIDRKTHLPIYQYLVLCNGPLGRVPDQICSRVGYRFADPRPI